MNLDLSTAGLSSANSFWDQTIDPRQLKEQKELEHSYQSKEKPILAHNLEDLIFNEELKIFVHKYTGECYRAKLNKLAEGTEWIPSITLTRHNNGHNIQTCNMGRNHTPTSITKHRAVYATINNMPYKGEYTVGHLDENSMNNEIDNLYHISGTKSKPNVEDKKLAYKLLALYKQGKITYPLS